MKVVFLGTPRFAVATLDALAEAGHDVVAVVAQPDRPAGRGHSLVSPPTVERARALGIATLQPTRIKTGDFPEAFEALRADVAVVVAYGRILTPRLLAAPRLGCVNVHASLLPRWRGAAPIQWAILAGDEETGITTMQMEEGLDTGPILHQERTPIGPEETAPGLFERLAPLGARLLVETLAEPLRPRPQPGEGVTHAPPLRKEQGVLEWARTAGEIDRQVRGLSGWPGTTTLFRGEALKVLRARPVEAEGEPGTVVGGATIATGAGGIELIEVQAAGRRPVSGADWVNGARVRPGERLG